MLHFYKFLEEEAYSSTDLHHICIAYIGVSICILGLIGNILSIVVWKRINRKRCDARKSAGVYLIVLAVTDNCLLVLFLCTEVLQTLKPNIIQSCYISFYSYFGLPLFYFFLTASVWTVTCITANRFIAVLLPLRSKVLNSLKKTYGLIFVVFFFSLVVNIPRFVYLPGNTNNETVLKAYHNKHMKMFHFYDFGVHCMFLLVVPCVIISILNTATIVRLCQRRREKSKRGNSFQEKQTTLILLTVSFSFLIFLMWQCAAQCFWIMGFEDKNLSNWLILDQFYDFGLLGIVFNSSSNFMLYCLTGKEFRKEICAIFKGYFCKR